MRPMVEDEVRRNLFFFEATLFDAVPEVLDELERTFDVRADGREVGFGSWAGSDMDGHPGVGAETLSRTLALHRADGARPAARPRRPARAGLQPLLAPHAGLPRAGGLARARRGRAALGARAAPRQPRVRAAALQARLHHPPARQHARPARARARLRRPAGAARRPLARARQRRLGARRQRRDPAAAVADRRLRLPRRLARRAPVVLGGPGGGRDAPARLPRRGRGRAAAAARGGDQRGPPRAHPPPRGPRGRAPPRARHGRARARGVRQARGAGDDHLDGRAAVRRAGRALAGAARGRAAAARAALRDARRPARRAGDDGRALRHARLPRLACARSATAS